MKGSMALVGALFLVVVAVNGWTMGAGEPRQPGVPLPDGQQRGWEQPEKEWEQQYPQGRSRDYPQIEGEQQQRQQQEGNAGQQEQPGRGREGNQTGTGW
jgi:hypothetical protein